MVVALLADGSQSANLNEPNALDASMSNADSEVDPSVTAVIEENSADAGDAAQASRAPGSSSPTPPLPMLL